VRLGSLGQNIPFKICNAKIEQIGTTSQKAMIFAGIAIDRVIESR
jgi:hypothetical protein